MRLDRIRLVSRVCDRSRWNRTRTRWVRLPMRDLLVYESLAADPPGDPEDNLPSKLTKVWSSETNTFHLHRGVGASLCGRASTSSSDTKTPWAPDCLDCLKARSRVFWIMDARAIYDFDKAICYSVCETLHEAKLEAPEYGDGCCVFELIEDEAEAVLVWQHGVSTDGA